MSTPSIHVQIRDEILRILKEELVFNPADGDKCKSIVPDSIVFRKVSVAERDINKGVALERMPAIIVSTPYEEPFNPGAGTVAHDEYRWSFLCQIVDKDHLDKTSNWSSYTQWQETITQRFQFICLQNVDVLHCPVNSMNVDIVDERYWLKEEAFKAGVHILTRPWIRGYGR